MAFFLYPAPARVRFPAPRRAWVPPLAGSGAGCTRVAVHAVGVHRFPAPARAPLPPRILAPRPAGGPAAAERRHLQPPWARAWRRGPQGLNRASQAGEGGKRRARRSPGTYSILSRPLAV